MSLLRKGSNGETRQHHMIDGSANEGRQRIAKPVSPPLPVEQRATFPIHEPFKTGIAGVTSPKLSQFCWGHNNVPDSEIEPYSVYYDYSGTLSKIIAVELVWLWGHASSISKSILLGGNQFCEWLPLKIVHVFYAMSVRHKIMDGEMPFESVTTWELYISANVLGMKSFYSLALPLEWREL